MDMHAETIRNLTSVTNWTTSTVIARDNKVTTTAVRLGFVRLIKIGYVERRRVVSDQPGQGGVRRYFEYRRTPAGDAFLAEREAKVKKRTEAAARRSAPKTVIDARRTGHPWFDLGLDCRPNFKTNSNQHC